MRDLERNIARVLELYGSHVEQRRKEIVKTLDDFSLTDADAAAAKELTPRYVAVHVKSPPPGITGKPGGLYTVEGKAVVLPKSKAIPAGALLPPGNRANAGASSSTNNPGAPSTVWIDANTLPQVNVVVKEEKKENALSMDKVKKDIEYGAEITAANLKADWALVKQWQVDMEDFHNEPYEPMPDLSMPSPSTQVRLRSTSTTMIPSHQQIRHLSGVFKNLDRDALPDLRMINPTKEDQVYDAVLDANAVGKYNFEGYFKLQLEGNPLVIGHIHALLKNITSRDAAALTRSLQRFDVRYQFLPALKDGPAASWAAPALLDAVTLITAKDGEAETITTFECSSCGNECSAGFLFCPVCELDFNTNQPDAFDYSKAMANAFENKKQVPAHALSVELKSVHERTLAVREKLDRKIED